MLLGGLLMAATLMTSHTASQIDVNAVRKAELAHAGCAHKQQCPLTVRKVTVVQSYALLEWISGPSGGEALWHKTHGSWHRITGGGGAMGPSDLEHYGVPHTIALQLLSGL
jgi:hypothetical protein